MRSVRARMRLSCASKNDSAIAPFLRKKQRISCQPRHSTSSRSLHNPHVEIAVLPQHRDGDVERMLLEQQINLSKRKLELEKPERGEERRQDRPLNRKAPVVGVDRQVDASLNHLKDDDRGPRLRRARDRVPCRSFPRSPMESAEELGQ